jgi:hypothetical protein
MYRLTSLLLVLLAVGPARADRAADVAALAKPGPDPAATRAAWDRVVAAGPPALLPLLMAWPTDDPIATNWLRTAFDQIARTHTDRLPTDDLLAFLRDPKTPGKARRVALAAVERARPGTTAKLLPGWLNDPEFGVDAVAERLAAAEATADPEQGKTILRTTFAATTDVDQALTVAKRLKEAGDTPDVIRHLGVVGRWQILGPLPVSPEEGLKQSFPPEAKLDLAAEYDGKTGKLKWLSAECDPTDGKVDLAKHGIKPDDGAVAFAAAKLSFTAPTKVEVRASAVDNITVWVNGKRAFERASEYRSMYRPDRYRAAVGLPAGESTVLVKLTKTRAEEVRGKPGAPAKWDFQIRLVDGTGRGLAFNQPEAKK